MAKKLFQYAIIYNAKRTKKHEDEGTEPASDILKDITSIVARDEKEVLLIAAREIPEKYKDKLDQVEIGIRPF